MSHFLLTLSEQVAKIRNALSSNVQFFTLFRAKYTCYFPLDHKVGC